MADVLVCSVSEESKLAIFVLVVCFWRSDLSQEGRCLLPSWLLWMRCSLQDTSESQKDQNRTQRERNGESNDGGISIITSDVEMNYHLSILL